MKKLRIKCATWLLSVYQMWRADFWLSRYSRELSVAIKKARSLHRQTGKKWYIFEDEGEFICISAAQFSRLKRMAGRTAKWEIRNLEDNAIYVTLKRDDSDESEGIPC